MFICDWGPRVPILTEIWGPGFHIKMGTRGPKIGGPHFYMTAQQTLSAQ